VGEAWDPQPYCFVMDTAREPPVATITGDYGTSAGDSLKGVAIYGFVPDRIGRPNPKDAPANLDADGTNLARALHAVRSEDAGLFDEIVMALCAAVPGLAGLSVADEGHYAALEFTHTGPEGGTFTTLAEQESDGTLRILAILCALYQTPAPSMIVIEEPELYVHPGALGVLADEIQACAYHRTQVLITTHSPGLISRLPVEALRAVEMRDGRTEIEKVHEVQRRTVEDKLFTAGELMQMEGLHGASWRGE